MIAPRQMKFIISVVLFFSTLLCFSETRISFVVVGNNTEERERIQKLLAYYIEGSPEYTYIDFEGDDSVEGSESEIIKRFGLELLLELKLTTAESATTIESEVYGAGSVDPILSGTDSISASDISNSGRPATRSNGATP